MSLTPEGGYRLVHVELEVAELEAMVRFYTAELGFWITDRSHGRDAMVFLSSLATEHHQLVLAASQQSRRQSRLDHVAFEVNSLDALRALGRRLRALSPETVTHGNSWSIYVRDPEDNRVEFFARTPWHVAQPARWEVDLASDDVGLLRSTREAAATMRGFSTRTDWERSARQGAHGLPDTHPTLANTHARTLLSSHRTSEGIVSYFRTGTGTTAMHLEPYC